MLRLVTFVHRQHIVIGPTSSSEEKRFQMSMETSNNNNNNEKKRLYFIPSNSRGWKGHVQPMKLPCYTSSHHHAFTSIECCFFFYFFTSWIINNYIFSDMIIIVALHMSFLSMVYIKTGRLFKLRQRYVTGTIESYYMPYKMGQASRARSQYYSESLLGSSPVHRFFSFFFFLFHTPWAARCTLPVSSCHRVLVWNPFPAILQGPKKKTAGWPISPSRTIWSEALFLPFMPSYTPRWLGRNGK